MKQKICLHSTAIACLVLSSFLALQSCKKSSSGASPTSDYYLTANVNAQSWSANVNSSLNSAPALAVIITRNGATNLVLLGIKAVNKDTTAVILIFPQNIALNKAFNFDESKYLLGAYVAETSPGSASYYGYNTTAATGGSGTITVSVFDQSAKIIEGSFSGVFGSQTGRAAVQIDNGKFRCPYTTDINQLPKSGIKF